MKGPITIYGYLSNCCCEIWRVMFCDINNSYQRIFFESSHFSPMSWKMYLKITQISELSSAIIQSFGKATLKWNRYKKTLLTVIFHNCHWLFFLIDLYEFVCMPLLKMATSVSLLLFFLLYRHELINKT